MLTEELIGKETTDMMPTDGELKAFIEKIAEILKTFFALFENLKDGLTQSFSKYERQLP